MQTRGLTGLSVFPGNGMMNLAFWIVMNMNMEEDIEEEGMELKSTTERDASLK